jgi:thiamine-phosphate pyrophosphorylase
MSWKKKSLKNFKLYAITDLKKENPGILRTIERSLAGGVDIIQLRSKNLSDAALFELGKKIRTLTARMKKLFIVNDRIDLALALDADGVHLGQDDLPTSFARKILGKNKFIGRSTHSLKQALEAEREGADYIGFGPIFGTPTKPDYTPIGLDQIAQVMKRIQIPVVCIGGIDRSNLKQVIRAGAERVAVVRAVFAARNPYQSAFQLKGLMNGRHKD